MTFTPTIADALDLFGRLSQKDRETLITIVSSSISASITIENFLSDTRFSSGRVCPYCGKTHIVRNGYRADGTQRYRCLECSKSFVATSNSIVSGTHKELFVWRKYIDCMLNGTSLRKTAFVCGINRNTAFLWRHKILDTLQNMANDVVLDGIVEADETFFAISYK